MLFHDVAYVMLHMRKPGLHIILCENIGADQLHSNCFRYIDNSSTF